MSPRAAAAILVICLSTRVFAAPYICTTCQTSNTHRSYQTHTSHSSGTDNLSQGLENLEDLNQHAESGLGTSDNTDQLTFDNTRSGNWTDVNRYRTPDGHGQVYEEQGQRVQGPTRVRFYRKNFTSSYRSGNLGGFGETDLGGFDTSIRRDSSQSALNQAASQGSYDQSGTSAFRQTATSHNSYGSQGAVDSTLGSGNYRGGSSSHFREDGSAFDGQSTQQGIHEVHPERPRNWSSINTYRTDGGNGRVHEEEGQFVTGPKQVRYYRKNYTSSFNSGGAVPTVGGEFGGQDNIERAMQEFQRQFDSQGREVFQTVQRPANNGYFRHEEEYRRRTNGSPLDQSNQRYVSNSGTYESQNRDISGLQAQNTNEFGHGHNHRHRFTHGEVQSGGTSETIGQELGHSGTSGCDSDETQQTLSAGEIETVRPFNAQSGSHSGPFSQSRESGNRGVYVTSGWNRDRTSGVQPGGFHHYEQFQTSSGSLRPDIDRRYPELSALQQTNNANFDETASRDYIRNDRIISGDLITQGLDLGQMAQHVDPISSAYTADTHSWNQYEHQRFYREASKPQRFSQQPEDPNQQTEDLTQQTEDLRQQTEDLIQQTVDLTQQTQDFTQQNQDLTQQNQDLTQQNEDLTQQSQDLTQQTEDFTQQTQDLNQQTQDLIQQTQDITQQSQDLTQQTQDLTQQTQDFTQQSQDLIQQTQQITQQSEDLNQQTQDLTQQTQDFTQQNQDLTQQTQQSEDLNQQTQDLIQQTQDFTQQSQDLIQQTQQITQQSEDLNQQTQDLTQQTQDFTQQNQDLTQQTQQSEDLNQQTQDLTQQTQDFTQQNQDLTQQTQQITQQSEDLNQQTQDLTQQTQDFTQQSQDLTQQTQQITQQSEDLNQQTQDLTQQTQDFTQQNQDLTQQTQQITQQSEDLNQQTQDITQQTQDLTQQTQDLTQQTQDLTQQTQDLTQQTEDLSQQTQDRIEQGFQQDEWKMTHHKEQIGGYEKFITPEEQSIGDQQKQDLFQQTEDLTQQTEDLFQQTEDLTQHTDDLNQHMHDLTQQSEDFTQQTQGFTQQSHDFTQQTQDLTQHTQDLTQQTQDFTQQSQDLTQQTEDLTQQSEDLTQQTEDLTQQTEDLTQQTEDLTQQTEDGIQVSIEPDVLKWRHVEQIGDPNYIGYDQKPPTIGYEQYSTPQKQEISNQQTEDLSQQSLDLTQQTEDLNQQTEDLTQQTEDLTQQTEDLSQQSEYTDAFPNQRTSASQFIREERLGNQDQFAPRPSKPASKPKRIRPSNFHVPQRINSEQDTTVIFSDSQPIPNYAQQDNQKWEPADNINQYARESVVFPKLNRGDQNFDTNFNEPDIEDSFIPTDDELPRRQQHAEYAPSYQNPSSQHGIDQENQFRQVQHTKTKTRGRPVYHPQFSGAHSWEERRERQPSQDVTTSQGPAIRYTAANRYSQHSGNSNVDPAQSTGQIEEEVQQRLVHREESQPIHSTQLSRDTEASDRSVPVVIGPRILEAYGGDKPNNGDNSPDIYASVKPNPSVTFSPNSGDKDSWKIFVPPVEESTTITGTPIVIPVTTTTTTTPAPTLPPQPPTTPPAPSGFWNKLGHGIVSTYEKAREKAKELFG